MTRYAIAAFGALILLSLAVQALRPERPKEVSYEDYRRTLDPAVPKPKPTKPPAPEPTRPEPVITLAEFQRVSLGESPEEIEAIIGAKGEESSRSEIGDTVTVIYSWKNPDGSNAIVMFQDGSSMQKSQFGLK